MATPKVLASVTTSWADVIGAAASVAGITWQNTGPNVIWIAFTTAAPAGGATDAYHILQPSGAYYDKSGAAHCWVKSPGGASAISATAD